MTMNKKSGLSDRVRLSDAALVLLSHAAGREDGMLLPPPASMRARGGALEKVLAKLLRQEMVAEASVVEAAQVWRSGEQGERLGLRITETGLQAIGIEPRSAEILEVSEARPEGGLPLAASPTSGSIVRVGSKQALLIEALGRPSGAALPELTALLGWQAHTVRAALTRLRQKGVAVTRSKNGNGEAIYRASAPEAAGDNVSAQAA